MSLVQAKCTNCGANLEVDNSKDAAICPYCQTPYVVEKAINLFNNTNIIQAENVTIINYNGTNKKLNQEFEKIEGYLKLGKYGSVYNTYTKLTEEYPGEYIIWRNFLDFLFFFAKENNYPGPKIFDVKNCTLKLCPDAQKDELINYIDNECNELCERIKKGAFEVIAFSNLIGKTEKKENVFHSVNNLNEYLEQLSSFNSDFESLVKKGIQIASKINAFNLKYKVCNNQGLFSGWILKDSEYSGYPTLFAIGNTVILEDSGYHDNYIAWLNYSISDSKEFWDIVNSKAKIARIYESKIKECKDQQITIANMIRHLEDENWRDRLEIDYVEHLTPERRETHFRLRGERIDTKKLKKSVEEKQNKIETLSKKWNDLENEKKQHEKIIIDIMKKGELDEESRKLLESINEKPTPQTLPNDNSNNSSEGSLKKAFNKLFKSNK